MSKHLINRPEEYARSSFRNMIAPLKEGVNTFTEGKYSDAYRDESKRPIIESFYCKLKDGLSVYDYKSVKENLWSRGVDENGYNDNTIRAVIEISDGKRKIEIKNGNNSYTNLPGGSVNKDEHPLNAALRELKEETTFEVPVNLQSKIKEVTEYNYELTLKSDEYNKLIEPYNQEQNVELTDGVRKIIIKNHSEFQSVTNRLSIKYNVTTYIIKLNSKEYDDFINMFNKKILLKISDGKRYKTIINYLTDNEANELNTNMAKLFQPFNAGFFYINSVLLKDNQTSTDNQIKTSTMFEPIASYEPLIFNIKKKTTYHNFNLQLTIDEYDEVTKNFNEEQFFEQVTPEISGISYKNKYLKYKQKYLQLLNDI